MTFMKMLELVIVAETAAGAIAGLFFSGWYLWKQGWPRTEHGWFMLGLGFTLGLLFSLVFTNRVFGSWPGRDVLIVIVYTSLVVLTIWMPRLVYISYDDDHTNSPEENNNAGPNPSRSSDVRLPT